MKKRFAMSALFVAVAVAAVDPAFAQSIPEGQSCGGLLCDMGVFGHKSTPGPNSDAAAPPAGPRAEAAPPPVVAPEPVVSAAKKRTVRTKKRIARAAVAPRSTVAAANKPTAAAKTTKPTASGASAISEPFSQPRPSNFTFQPIYR